ncbi:tetratricopeptide repeat protein [Marinomonas rhizomae]|uniref:Tetratricopeptide repeat protein n=1 Tax=Marinomonas rhizomae TaxID=491948 RepID=A0A366J625_9GAMM|nr:tetratricopeptide repeat protein [Marinomonas rhizomae]RBP82382.1 tetratricopeptide repeat protein [Marinomonas rhizomae]
MPAVIGPAHKKAPQEPIKKGFLLLLALLSLSILNACGQNSPQQNTLPPITESLQEKSAANQNKLEELLNAEFTLQREGPNKAFEPFYELASKSGDIILIERLMHIAVASQNHLYIERSANLWLSADPTAEAAYSLKLQILVKDNRTEEVTTLLTNAIRHKVSLRFLPLYLEDNVRDSDQLNTIDDAISALPTASKNNQYIQLSYAHLLLLSGKYQMAINSSEKLLAEGNTDKNETLYLILAFSQKNLGFTDDAIKTLQLALKNLPDNTRVITPLIDLLVVNEQAKLASETYQKADLSSPEKLQVGINLMRTLLENDQPKLALATANSLPEEQLGLSDQIQYLTAIAMAQLGERTQAIELMKKVEGPLRTNATNQIALWLYDEGREDDINRMVINRTPRENMPEQVTAISHLHEEKGHIDMSFQLVSDALLALPESDVLRYHKALLADTLGNWKTTESELKKLLQKDPQNPQYLNALGYTLLTRTKRIDEAMEYIESAYEKTDNDPAIIDSLGWGFFLKGKLEQSSYYLKKAWSILPDAEIAAHYGESLWKQRHYKEAILIWETALDSSPNTPLLLDTIKRLSPSLLEEQKQDKSS